MRKIQQDSSLHLHLVVSGMHLSPAFGLTINDIERDGFEPADRVDMLLSSDTPEGIAKSMGIGTIGFADSYARVRPDILLVLGDRFEILAAVSAVSPFNIPVAHIHGGESTEGAIDESYRHAITKLSHLHFVSAEPYFFRIVQMGEEPWRVKITGAPGLDNLQNIGKSESNDALDTWLRDVGENFLLATYHPATLDSSDTGSQMDELLSALDHSGLPVLFTYPNADAGNRAIINKIQIFQAERSRVRVETNLGSDRYFNLMGRAAAMVGNSSSGIIEAASFRLPVVNIGARQQGRIRPVNVLDVACDRAQILSAVKHAVSSIFKESLKSLINPYGDGHASERIVDRLKTVNLNQRLLQKRFHDLGAVQSGIPDPLSTGK